MKVLVDMNLSPSWVRYLAGSGFEAIHWSSVGAGRAPDTELMQWASEHRHVVLTADLDFGAILAATQKMRPNMLQMRSEILTPVAISAAVVATLRQTRQELLDDALVSVD